MTENSQQLTDRVINGFNQRDFSGAVAALKILQEQDTRESPHQWERRIAAINANVDLQKLGIKDAGQIMSVNNRGELVTGDPTMSYTQTRAADSNLTLRQQSSLYSYRGDMAGMPYSRDPAATAQMSLVNDMRRQAELARIAQLPAGDHKLSLTVEGQQRIYDVHVPPGLQGAAPVYFTLHGAAMDAAPRGEMADETQINRIADERKFIAVHLYAATHQQRVTGTLPLLGMDISLNDKLISYHSWNSPGAGMNVTRPDYDDVNYVAAVRANVARQLNVDQSRQYLIGFSEGGEFANHLAARMPFAGIASIHGTHLGTEAPPTRPTAFISITGEQDGVLPRDGRRGKFHDFYPRLSTSQPMRQFETWRAANGCRGHVDGSINSEEARTIYRAEQCTSGRPVVDVNRTLGRHTIDGNFTWMGSSIARLLGERKEYNFDATRTAVDFLQQYRTAQ